MSTIKELGKRLAARLDEDDWGYVEPFLRECDSEIETLKSEVKRLKTVPMKYRRMQFNAQLQSEAVTLKAEIEFQRNAHSQAQQLLLEQGKQLAESQATNAKLREALSMPSRPILAGCLTAPMAATDMTSND